MSEILLDAQHLSLTYQPKSSKAPVFEDVSLQLAAGEVVTLLGFSGSGKSSLLRVLAGLRKPTRGTVTLRQEVVVKPHARIGFMFQDPCLLPWLNLEDNVAFGLKLKHQPSISKAERRERVREALQEVGLQEAAHHYPSALSGGMAQRGSLARSLVRQPEILLLDEPFSALDAVTRAQMQQLLLTVIKKHGTSVVLVTHDIDEALQVSDRVLLLGGKPSHVVDSWNLTGIKRGANSAELARVEQEILTTLRADSHALAVCDATSLLAIPA